MLDVAALATTVVSSVLLPYLKDGAAKIAETVSEKAGQGMGEYAADLAGKVWDKVKSAFSSEDEKVVLKEFEAEPEDAAPLIEKKLRKKLEQDQALAEEMDQLVNSTAPDGQSTGAQIFGSSQFGIVDMRGAHLSGSGHQITGASFSFGEPMASGIAPPPRHTPPQPGTTRDKTGEDS